MIMRATVASGRQGEEGDRCDPEAGMCFPKAHPAYETVKSFLYVHSIDWLHKDKILNLKLAMFHLKCKVSNKCHNFLEKVIFRQLLT